MALSPSRFNAEELPDIELELIQLSKAIDAPRSATAFGLVAAGLASRARSIWMGIHHASEGPSNATVQLALRALVELTILLPWLATNPEVHLRLWAAEGERQIRKLLRNAPTHAGPRLAAALAEQATPERLAALDAAVNEARAIARSNGVRGVGTAGSLLPSIEKMVEVVGTPAAREAYGIAYNMLSSFTHTGARGLGVRFEADGVLLDDGAPDNPVGDRTLAAIAFAITLMYASEHIGLGIESRVAELRDRMLA